MTNQTVRFCSLADSACIQASGPDAERFLHAQLGIDVAGVSDAAAPLAGWHDARGRLRILFRLYRTASSWQLWLPRDQLAVALAKLAMYVLRADVKLAENPALSAAAIVGDGTTWCARHFPGLETRAGALSSAGLTRCVYLGPQLRLVFGPAGELAALSDGLAAGTAGHAELAQIELGLPSVPAALAEQYLPQMLNLDLLGAMSFDKGCYPGQEIIARTHNLGSVKRRMRRFAATAPLSVGEEVRTTAGASVGKVLRAASVDGRTELLAVVQLDALQHALFAGDGPQIELTPLPVPYVA